VAEGIDFVVLRENLEGLFASFGGGCIVADEVAVDNLVITRAGTARLCDYAFRLSASRGGSASSGRRAVVCVDKANIFRSFALFRKTFFEVARGYGDIKAEAMYVDAMSLAMLQNPAALDVLVMENQFGDILSELGAGLVGGLGLAPSAEIGERHALFQPSHGTAPQLAGRNMANPLAMILSGAMMLDWLGRSRDDSRALRAARHLELAVTAVLDEGRVLTQDLGGRAGTREVGEAVSSAVNGLDADNAPCGLVCVPGLVG
jgi:3-isopropylmalate dehydrogenase